MSLDLQYPVGRFQKPSSFSPADRTASIAALAALPANIHTLVERLSAKDLERTYRPGGWTIRQLVHHMADSHLNAYIRTKLALTQDAPTINAYDQQIWSTLPDNAAPVTTSLHILDGLHPRFVVLLNALRPSDFERAMNHPENGRMTIDHAVAMYAWHSRHHTAHIRLALGLPA